jgi:hypothetical protein
MKADEAVVSPETTWQKIKDWPSAVLAEFAIRIQEEIKTRATQQREAEEKKRSETPKPVIKVDGKGLEKLVRIALSQVGVREVGGNNRGAKVREYQAATTLKPAAWPWCAAFTGWCIREWLKDKETAAWLGLKVLTPEKWRPKTAAAFGYIEWAKARPATTKIIPKGAAPRVGDIAVFDFSHIGIITKVNKTNFLAVEGNALPLTSKVLTPNGFKLMKDIKVGDEVIDPNGETSFVTGVFPKGKRDLYKIGLQDKSSAIACDEHLWMVQVHGVKDKVLSTIDLKRLIERTKARPRVPQIHPVDFAKSDNLPIEPYLMGLLLGEGGMSGGYLGFTNVDEEIINHVGNSLISGHIIKPHISNENAVRGNHRIVSTTGKNEMIKILRDLGLYGKKSFEKFIPDAYKMASIEDRLSLVQGLMDSDGSVDKIGRCDFASSSQKLSEDLMDVIRSLGGRCALNLKTNIFYTSPTQKTPKRARDCYRLQNINMPFFNLFRLKRKADRFKFRNTAWARRIISVESCGTGDVQCISVSAKSKLFITDNYIPTHNTNGRGDRDSVTGDGVWLKTRSFSTVRCYIRINPSTAR